MSDRAILVLVGACLAVGTVVDCLVLPDYPFSALYALPMLLAATRLSRPSLTIVAAVAALALIANVASNLYQNHDRLGALIDSLSLLAITVIAVLLAVQRGQVAREAEARSVDLAQAERARAVAEAQRATAEAARCDAAFLARVSAALAVSLDYGETLQNIARLPLGRLGDWSVLDVIEAEGVRRAAVAHVDPLQRDCLQLFRRLCAGTAPAGPVTQAIETGQPVLCEDVPAALLGRQAGDATARAIVSALGAGSCLILPLFAHGRLLAMLFLLSADASRHGPEAVAFAAVVARRLALALANAQAYQAALVARGHAITS